MSFIHCFILGFTLNRLVKLIRPRNTCELQSTLATQQDRELEIT